ncbi:MAG: hypothetical protein IJ251_08210 [Oscillospiraceae bacterium]|nr:hypothetical protein [Oscillospiraceae bacterium]
MLYDQMFGMAKDLAVRQQQYGGFSPQDTICVVCSGTGRLYYGVSGTENVGGAQVAVHAEVNAVRQLLANGENVVTSLLLVSANELGAMLPCSGCVQFILSQNAANRNAMILLPDRQISVMEAAGGAVPGGMMRSSPVPPAARAASSDLLKSRVGDLMDIDDEDEDEDDEPKGLFGRLFGRK